MDLKVASPQSVHGQVVAKLREAIFAGLFEPGGKLVEAQLCRDMGVSRGSLREALRSLEAEKLVTITPNRGPSVTLMSWAEAAAIYHVRALLEGEAMALFAPRVSPAEIQAMVAALDDFEDAVHAQNALSRMTSTERFYTVILDGCGNAVIAELLRGVQARINFLRVRSMSRPGRAQESAREMRIMLAALKARDPVAGRQAAIDHIRAASAAARFLMQPDDRVG